jgi:hypothetical protein
MRQKGPCAFSAACVIPGDRHRLEGTNREFCGPHFGQLQLPSSPAIAGTEFARTNFTAPRTNRRRSAWATYVGVVEVC